MGIADPPRRDDAMPQGWLMITLLCYRPHMFPLEPGMVLLIAIAETAVELAAVLVAAS